MRYTTPVKTEKSTFYFTATTKKEKKRKEKVEMNKWRERERGG